MIKTLNILLLLSAAAVAELRSSGPPLETRKQWSVLTYNLPWDFPANDKEFYDPEGVVATGIAVDYNRIYIATPRLFSGVPATISSVSRKEVGDSPVLEVSTFLPIFMLYKSPTKNIYTYFLGLPELVFPYSRHKAVQLQWSGFGIRVQDAFGLLQSSVGTWRW